MAAMITPTEVRAVSSSGASRSPISVEVFALSDVGRTREHNEDAFIVCDLAAGRRMDFPETTAHRVGERGMLMMVADGMGGAAAGELASATAIDVVLRHLRSTWAMAPHPSADQFARALEAAAHTANGVIFRFAAEHAEVHG